MTTDARFVPEAVPPSAARRLTRRQRRAGGRTTARRHGSPYMVRIGRRGGTATLLRRGRSHFAAAGVIGAAAFDAKYSREVRAAICRHAMARRAARPQLDRYFQRLEVELVEEEARDEI